MADFTWTPDQGLGRTTRVAVQEVKFGDGYRQRATLGINSLAKSWSLSFNTRTKSEIDAIDAFLATKNGSPFTVQFPGSALVKVTCDEWTTNNNHDLDASLNATFEIWYGA